MMKYYSLMIELIRTKEVIIIILFRIFIYYSLSIVTLERAPAGGLKRQFRNKPAVKKGCILFLSRMVGLIRRHF